MAHDPSEILIVYLGAEFPHDAKSAREAIEKYLQFPDYPPTEWSSSDLPTEQRIYEQRLGRAFPELNARATSALACRWSYSWR
jgi:hypothetical protein